MAETHILEALNLYDTINIKAVRSLISGKVVDSSPQELQVTYGEKSFLFVYRFGCLVFFNVSKQQRDSEIERLRAALGPGLMNSTSESYQVLIEDGPPKVEFEYVSLKKPELAQLRIIALTLGQSAALEYFEIQVDRMLADTSNLMINLSRGRRLPMIVPRRLVNLIGSTASTRQHIISNISILDPPEETWKSKELERLYTQVKENFDIEVRFKVLDRKLSVIQDNLELLTDLSSTQGSHLLELLVVFLIIFEIVLALIGKH